MRKLGIVALGLALTGCAGRMPAPTAVFQPTDQFTNCTAILAAISANKERVKLIAAEGLKSAQNGNTNIAGMFVPVRFVVHGFPRHRIH